MATPDDHPSILAATQLEVWALRRQLRNVPVLRTGVALGSWTTPTTGGTAILCGLAGGLQNEFQPGAVVIPDVVGLPDGRLMDCDARWTAKLRAMATQLGHTPASGPLLTAPELVTGPTRAEWGRQGFVAADMEAGLLMHQGWRVATVRVLLDTPAHPVDGSWERPGRAILTPRLWRELLWLATRAPHYSLLAARIVGRTLEAA